MPAATALAPSLHDRLGEHGRRGGAVARDVGGLGGDLAHHLRAHVLELVLELDLLRDRHAVLGDARRAERLVEHDIAALRAERDPHGVGEDVDAAQHAVARVDREFYVFGSHCVFPLISQGEGRPQAAFFLATVLFEDAHHVGLLHDQEILAVDLDLGARPLAEQDAVADLEVDRDQLAGLVAATRADGDDFALRGLFLGGVGNDDAAGGLLLGIDALDDDAVVKRAEFHGYPPKLLDSRVFLKKRQVERSPVRPLAARSSSRPCDPQGGWRNFLALVNADC